MPHVEQDLLTLSEHLRSHRFWWGSCCLVFSFLCCVFCTIICRFVFLFFSHGVVGLFTIYDSDCPSGIFSPSFKEYLKISIDCWKSYIVSSETEFMQQLADSTITHICKNTSVSLVSICKTREDQVHYLLYGWKIHNYSYCIHIFLLSFVRYMYWHMCHMFLCILIH